MKHQKRSGRHSSSGSSRHSSGQGRGLDAGRLQRVELTIPPQAPARWPSISVCMIVKDEAANVGACLESLGSLASEIIVVDTGSSDDTVALVESLGARVYHFPWVGDFAAARNESLRHATKEWIFWLDADDRLGPKAVAQIKRACGMGSADAYMCLVSSRTVAGNQDITEHIRLFRNGLGIRFSGAIHETVFPDLVQKRLRLAFTDVVIEHTGYSSPEAVKRKSARNLAIIEGQAGSGPCPVDLLFYRGHSRAGAGDLEGAESDMREYLARTSLVVASEWKRFWAYNLLCVAHEKRGDHHGTEELLGQALAEFADHPQFLLSLARLRLSQDRAIEAESLLKRARHGLQQTVRGCRPSEGWVEVSLAECYRKLGRKQLAVQWAEQARKHAPHLSQPATLLVRLYLDYGRITEAERLVEELLASQEGFEPWLLLASVRHAQGQPEKVADAIREARARGLPEERAEALLAELKATMILSATRTQVGAAHPDTLLQMAGLALLARKEHLQAAECFGKSIERAPSNPDNYRYLAVALRGLGREKEALEAWELASRCQAMAQSQGSPLRSPRA